MRVKDISIPLNRATFATGLTIVSAVFGSGYYFGSKMKEIEFADKYLELRMQMIDGKIESLQNERELREEMTGLKLELLKRVDNEK